MSYWDDLRHPKWQERRLDILKAAGFKCVACGNAEEELHVHHTRYVRGRKPWEYEDFELRALCKTCHAEITDILGKIQLAVGSLSSYSALIALGFIRALMLEDGVIGALTVVDFYDSQGVARALGISIEDIEDLTKRDGALTMSAVLDRWRENNLRSIRTNG